MKRGKPRPRGKAQVYETWRLVEIKPLSGTASTSPSVPPCKSQQIDLAPLCPLC